MVDVDQKQLEKYIKEIENTPDLQQVKRFVENFFSSVGSQSLDHAYMNYMRDMLMYAPTNKAIDENRTYLCWMFKDVTGAGLEQLAEIEYRFHGGPQIYPL